MRLTASRDIAARLEALDESVSTNTELLERVRSDPADRWPDFSVLVTDNQTQGHGRRGRRWSAPAGSSLAISVLLRPHGHDGRMLGPDTLGWIPLIAGLAMTRAVRSLGVDAGLKWPNDVLAADGSARPGKLCGVLAEVAPDAAAVVVGAGVNLRLRQDELPVETASSLVLCGLADPDPDAVLSGYLRELGALYDSWRAQDGDAVSSGLREAVVRTCTSLSRPVRVELPDGDVLSGTGADIDERGRLVVDSASGYAVVSAGDVKHLRY